MTDTLDDLRAEVASLRAEIDALKATQPGSDEPATAEHESDLPAGAFRDQCGILRNARGEVLKAEETPEDDARRVAEFRAREDAKHAEVMRYRTEGLPSGFWRDNCGRVRDHRGEIAIQVED